jgi:hypothetical protein
LIRLQSYPLTSKGITHRFKATGFAESLWMRTDALWFSSSWMEGFSGASRWSSVLLLSMLSSSLWK